MAEGIDTAVRQRKQRKDQQVRYTRVRRRRLPVILRGDFLFMFRERQMVGRGLRGARDEKLAGEPEGRGNKAASL